MLFIMFNNQGVQQELQGAHQGPHEDSRNGVGGKAIFLRPVWGEVNRLEKSLGISIDDASVVDATAIVRIGQGKT